MGEAASRLQKVDAATTILRDMGLSVEQAQQTPAASGSGGTA
jgi:hypothetical protein